MTQPSSEASLQSRASAEEDSKDGGAGEVLVQLLEDVDKDFDSPDQTRILERLEQAHTLHPEDPRIMTRLARAFCMHVSNTSRTATLQDRLEQVTRAVQLAEKAVELDPNSSFQYKWLAIALGRQGELGGVKVKLQTGHLYKQHVMKAMELDPEDGELPHLLGRWCFNVSQIGYLKRLAAKVFYGEVPEAKISEAVAEFRKSHRLRPNWIMNRIWYAHALILHGKEDRKELSRQPLEAEDEIGGAGESLEKPKSRYEQIKLQVKHLLDSVAEDLKAMEKASESGTLDEKHQDLHDQMEEVRELFKKSL